MTGTLGRGGLRCLTGAVAVAGFLFVSAGAAFAGDALPGDGRGSTPEERQASGGSPRVGNNFDPSTGRVEHSYDWKQPVDTTGNPVQFPWLNPPAVLPRDLVVVQNRFYNNPNASQERHPHRDGLQEARYNDDQANMVGTDVVVPGSGIRVFSVTMGCPRSGKRVGPDRRPSQENHDGYWTGHTMFDPNERHLHFSYQMGDRMFDDAWLWGHYGTWGIANY